VAGDSNGTRLEAFSSNFEQKYIDNRHATILNEARNLLLKNDYHNTVTAGVDVHENKEKDRALHGMDDGMSIFELHRSSISVTASKLMELCRETMEEAVRHAMARNVEDKDTPLAVLSPTLYRAAREILDLFRAIIPATHGNEIASVPRTAAVFHNDCVFFQYHCLWLGLEFKAKLPPQPKETDDARGTLFHQACMFVDMVPLFRELADKSMGDMLDRQTHQMVDIVGKRITLFGQALRSDEILAEWSEAETALTAGLYHMRHLCETWCVILSRDVFVRSVGHLADALFTLYLEQVTQAKDISESACHFVSSLFQKAISTIEELLHGDKSGSLVWDRFFAVGKFMNMRLMDIQTGLADGVFRSVTGPELSSLITATFSDSPKRQRLLQALSSQ
jgi:centromere/kinetochore protein ZW10